MKIDAATSLTSSSKSRLLKRMTAELVHTQNANHQKAHSFGFKFNFWPVYNLLSNLFSNLFGQSIRQFDVLLSERSTG